MNYSLRVTRVKKINRALLTLLTVSVMGLAPLGTFAQIKPDSSVRLIIDKHAGTSQLGTGDFMTAALKARPILKTARTAKAKDVSSKPLVLTGSAVLNNRPSRTEIARKSGGSLANPANSSNETESTNTALKLTARSYTGQSSSNLITASAVSGSVNLTPPATKLPETTKSNKSRTALPAQLVKPAGPRYGPERFYDGYCTEYVARYYDHGRGLAWYDNASAWLYRAQKAGWPTGSSPRVGAIMVTSEGGGHVALVESINYSNHTFRVGEQNYVGFGVVSHRPISFGAGFIKGFIY